MIKKIVEKSIDQEIENQSKAPTKSKFQQRMDAMVAEREKKLAQSK